MGLLVLDTNVVLDLWLFQDPRTESLRQALKQGEITCLATAHMREELRRVLAYPHLVECLNFYQKSAEQVLTHYDAHSQLVEAPGKAPWTCKDPDDQVFIDLAVAHQCPLISKDKAVLALRGRLARSQVAVSREWAASSSPTQAST